MPTYSLVITAANGRQHVHVHEFADDATAIREAGDAVDEHHPCVAIGRGSGGELALLGSWEFEQDEPLWWSEE